MRTGMMIQLNSDQLRRQLDENNIAMNTLAENNEKIVELLKQRGLQAIDSSSDDVSIHPCVMQLDKLGEPVFRTKFEPKRREEIALTADELKTGGWWCADLSAECEKAFVANNLTTWANNWTTGKYDRRVCRFAKGQVYRVYPDELDSMEDIDQIHRRGNSFYWGAQK